MEENASGVRDLRSALGTEIANVDGAIRLLQNREIGQPADGREMRLGLQVMALTDASWRAASATGAAEALDLPSAERFAAAYFEQARLAALQTTTLDTMMQLSALVGRGDEVARMNPSQAAQAEAQARLLQAHLRMMLRMSDGLQDAYHEALAGR